MPGPFTTGKAYIFQALGYGYDTVTVPSLPNPDNVRIVEKINTYTQLDWDPSAESSVYRGASRSIPRTPTTPISTRSTPSRSPPIIACATTSSLVTHRWILANGGFVQTLFSAKHLDARVYPATQTGEMILFPEQNSGSYFEQQQRDTHLYQWSQTLHLRPIEHAGQASADLLDIPGAHSSYQGTGSNFPIQVLREDGTLSSSIGYRSRARFAGRV